MLIVIAHYFVSEINVPNSRLVVNFVLVDFGVCLSSSYLNDTSLLKDTFFLSKTDLASSVNNDSTLSPFLEDVSAQRAPILIAVVFPES